MILLAVSLKTQQFLPISVSALSATVGFISIQPLPPYVILVLTPIVRFVQPIYVLFVNPIITSVVELVLYYQLELIVTN